MDSMDEIDIAPTRLPPAKEVKTKEQRIHIIWDIFAVGSILTIIADLVSDMVVSVRYYRDGSYEWFGLTLGFVLLSSVVTQFISVKWYREDGKIPAAPFLVYVLHLLHLGPVVRYSSMIRSGCRTRQKGCNNSDDYDQYMAEWRDISMLRLFEAFLESAPQLVLQLYIMAYHHRFNIENDWFTVIAAGCSLISLAWAIVGYTKALRDFVQNQANVSWVGVVLQIIWRVFMVASRVISLVVIAAEYGSWLFLALVLHWLVMAVWLIFQSTTFCSEKNGRKHRAYELLFDMIIGFIYIFSFFNMKDGITRIRLITYYCIMLVENTVCVVMWYPARHYYSNLEYPVLIIVWGGFFLGSFCMICYYNFYHPSLAVKGMCVRKKQYENTNPTSTITWCCCCAIHTGQDIPTTVHQRQYCRYTHRPPTTQREYSPSNVDMEIVLCSSLSHKRSPGMAEPPVTDCTPSSNGAVLDSDEVPRSWPYLATLV